MKTTFLMLLCTGLLLSACKKNHVNKPQPLITGTWELRATKEGNILPATFPAGNGNLVTFADTSYSSYSSGNLVTHGGFRQHSDINGNATFTFTTGNFKSDFGTLLGDTLKIKPFNPDAASSYYVRK